MGTGSGMMMRRESDGLSVRGNDDSVGVRLKGLQWC